MTKLISDLRSMGSAVQEICNNFHLVQESINRQRCELHRIFGGGPEKIPEKKEKLTNGE